MGEIEKDIEQLKQEQIGILQRLLELERVKFEEQRQIMLEKQTDLLRTQEKLKELGAVVVEPIVPLVPQEPIIEN